MMFLTHFFKLKYGCLLLGILCMTGMVTGCGSKDEAIVLIPSENPSVEMAALESVEKEAEITAEDEKAAEKKETGTAQATVYVYVCGAVYQPGVVEVAAGSRAEEALRLVGGMTAEADPFYVNLAETVTDGQKLYFPTAEEAETMTVTAKAKEDGLVNINTASSEELCTLPGIGASRAADIIRYREKCGSFQTKEDIMKVSGIKQNAYDKLCDHITVQ